MAIVPARHGSRRLDRKNLRVLGGKPLVVRAIETALGAKLVDLVCVSTNDEEVVELSSSYAAITIRRPPELSHDTSPAIDYVQHAITVIEAERCCRVSDVVIIQATSPFTEAVDIDASIELLRRSGADTVVSVVKLPHDVHPSKYKVLQGDRLLPYLIDEGGRVSVDELPPVYVRNCSVYVSTRACIDTGKIIGPDCRAYVMPRERSLDINDHIDWEFALFMESRLGGHRLVDKSLSNRDAGDTKRDGQVTKTMVRF